MSENFMKVYSFLLSAVVSGELRARGPDNPDALEMVVDRELCWDWVIEERHLFAFLEQRPACISAPRGFPGGQVSLEQTRDAPAAAPFTPRLR